MQPFWQEPRPPYIVFERRAVEKRKLIEDGGASYFVDVDFILITPHGSKDRIERVWEEYEAYLVRLVKNGEFPSRWLEEYRAGYKSWVAGEGIPVNGTPVRTWPAITPAELKALTKAEVRTVEDLAQANEQQIANIGMGGRALKQRAQDWLNAQTGPGALAEQMTALRSTNDAMQRQLTDALRKIDLLTAQAADRGVPQPRPQPSGFIHNVPAPREPEPFDETADVDAALADAKTAFATADEDE